MAGEQKPACNLLEQFILLARGTSGSALIALINQVLEAPGIYVFGELLELTNVREIAEGPNAAYFQLLNLFAYGTYPDYVANQNNLPALTGPQKNKLKHLTIVSLASRMKCIPYSVLLKDLDMRNLRELEDLIIEAVYTDIIQGKLDQRNQVLEVDFCIGRDIQRKDISNVIKTLNEWCDGCEAVLLGIEQQVLRANQYKENHNRTQQQVEMEVLNIKKTLKATASSSSSAQGGKGWVGGRLDFPGQRGTAGARRPCSSFHLLGLDLRSQLSTSAVPNLPGFAGAAAGWGGRGDVSVWPSTVCISLCVSRGYAHPPAARPNGTCLPLLRPASEQATAQYCSIVLGVGDPCSTSCWRVPGMFTHHLIRVSFEGQALLPCDRSESLP
uniref:COP9 signalosome subunit 7B n=1 Tax=Naja naja TaxID=35670 RepID=A0A8C6X7L3_NAJNA